MVIVKDIYLTAAELKLLEDKEFTIAKGARYEDLPLPGKDPVSKLILPVKLSNRKVRDWIPNKTSIGTMFRMWEDNTDEWIGKVAKFELVKQNVRGEMKDVIFVEELAKTVKP